MSKPISAPSEDDRRAYLLRQASDAQTEAVEISLFEDPDAHEHLLALEQSLVDDYVAGVLSKNARAAFERRMRDDERLREAVRITRGLDRVKRPASKDRRGRNPSRGIWFARGFAFVAVAAVATVIVGPRLIEPPSQAFRAKGSATAVFRPVCLPTCRIDGTLTFEIAPPADRPYFAAFGRRADGRIVWYEPAANTSSRAGAPGAITWPRSFTLGAEHTSGPHTVFGVFSDRPLTRAAIAAEMSDDLAASEALTVFSRELLIEETP